MKHFYLALIILIFPQDVLLKTVEKYEEGCAFGGRCLPHESSWPSTEQWRALNESVHGRLGIPYLTVEPCLESDHEFDAEICQKSLQKLSEDPFYLQQFPGGVQSTGT